MRAAARCRWPTGNRVRQVANARTIKKTIPIAVRPNETAISGSSTSIAACVRSSSRGTWSAAGAAHAASGISSRPATASREAAPRQGTVTNIRERRTSLLRSNKAQAVSATSDPNCAFAAVVAGVLSSSKSTGRQKRYRSQRERQLPFKVRLSRSIFRRIVFPA